MVLVSSIYAVEAARWHDPVQVDEMARPSGAFQPKGIQHIVGPCVCSIAVGNMAPMISCSSTQQSIH